MDAGPLPGQVDRLTASRRGFPVSRREPGLAAHGLCPLPKRPRIGDKHVRSLVVHVPRLHRADADRQNHPTDAPVFAQAGSATETADARSRGASKAKRVWCSQHSIEKGMATRVSPSSPGRTGFGRQRPHGSSRPPCRATRSPRHSRTPSSAHEAAREQASVVFHELAERT